MVNILEKESPSPPVKIFEVDDIMEDRLLNNQEQEQKQEVVNQQQCSLSLCL